MSQSISVTDDYDIRPESFMVVLDSRNSDVNIYDPNYYSATDKIFKLYSNSNLTFTYANPLIDNKDILSSSCSVLNFTCPNSQNTINDSNNTLVFGCDNSQTGTFDEEIVQFDNGNYNPNSFIIEMAGQLNGLYPNGDFIITFSSITNKITISAARDFYFFSYAVNTFNMRTTNRYEQAIGAIMGFNDVIADGETVTVNGKTSYTGILYPNYVGRYNITMPLPVNFSGLNSLNIYLANLVTRNIDSFTNETSGIICNVPVNCPPNDVIYFDKRSNFEFKLGQEYLNSLTVHLKDNIGNFLDLQGQNWNLTLEFSLLRRVPKQIKTFTEIIR